MILSKELSRVPFRDDILRGVRLFAIAFAGILLCVAAYRLLRPPFEAKGAAPEAPPAAQESAPDAAPASEAAAEPHPLVVPPPPPVGGTPPPAIRRVVRPRNRDVPPPPLVRAKRAQATSGRDFESSELGGVLPSAPGDESSEASQAPGKKGVGYKSLIEANANRPPEEPAGEVAPDQSPDKPGKANRLLRAVGKILHVGGKKETTPSALQPKQPE